MVGGIIFLLIIIYFQYVIAILSGPEGCGVFVLDRISNLNNTKEVVVFDIDCGATTDFGAGIAIIEPGDQIDINTHKVFSADTEHGLAPRTENGGPEVRIEWLDNESIIVGIHKDTRVFKSESEMNGVSVKYSRFEE